MAYPTSLDSLTDPTSTQTLNAPSHSAIETAQNTAIEALEAKVGITGSAVATSLDYKLTNASSASPGHTHVVADVTDAGAFVVTGIILPYASSAAPTGFLLCDGSAVSRTTYAALFGVISTNFGSGDGATTFNVPDLRSKFIVGAGTAGTRVATFASRASNVITVTGLTNAANNEFLTGQSVTYHTTGDVITGLSNDTAYFVVRTGNLTFSLATNLTNAQNGTVISLSSDGSGTQTFTKTFTARTLADYGGEENHAMSSTEILAHTHDVAGRLMATGAGTEVETSRAWATGGSYTITTDNVTGSRGGNAAMNNMPPFVALTYVIKT